MLLVLVILYVVISRAIGANNGDSRNQGIETGWPQKRTLIEMSK